MAFPRLSLRDAPRPAAGLPTRADVAVFVGLIARTATPVPPPVREALETAGWAGSGPFARPAAAVEALLDVPVPVDSWGAFEALYAWDRRPVESGAPATIPARLGLAVRSFFAEGGAKAWIIRTGDPLPVEPGGSAAAAAAAKRAVIAWAPGHGPADAAVRVPLIPGMGGEGEATAPATWHGVEHIWGIDDAALLLLPDLAELLAPAPAPVPDLPQPPPISEDWKDCAPLVAGFAPDPRRTRPPVAAPRLDRSGYGDWAAQIRAVLDKLGAPRGSAHRRDVMLVASLPLPSPAPSAVPDRSEAWPLALLDEVGIAAPGLRLFDRDAIGSARLQLAWPWVETQASAGLPEGLEGGEGVLAGALARSAMALGAFRSAAGSALPSVRRLWPELGNGDLERALPSGRSDWMGDRLTLIDAKAAGFALLSDSTVATDIAWRSGGTSRLMGIILRAARWLGQERLFGAAGPALWAGMRNDVESFLERLRQAGALDGATPADAYQVRCDRSTMTQSDIDQGRTVVSIAVNPAQPVGWITVTLAMGSNATPLERAA